MRDQIIDIRTVRVGHVILFDITTKPTTHRDFLTLTLVGVHADVDGKTLRTFGQVEYGWLKIVSDYRILALILDFLPPIDACAPDSSHLSAHEVRRNGSLVECAYNVQNIWGARKYNWTQSESDLCAIHDLTNVSFIAL